MTHATDALADRLTRLLNESDLPVDPVTRLISADAVFGRLDTLLRSGDALPTPWGIRLGGGGVECMEVTEHYDALSEALREIGGDDACWRALRRAKDRWGLLRNAITGGAPLPEPWERG